MRNITKKHGHRPKKYHLFDVRPQVGGTWEKEDELKEHIIIAREKPPIQEASKGFKI